MCGFDFLVGRGYCEEAELRYGIRQHTMHENEVAKSEQTVAKALEQFLRRYKLSEKLTTQQVRQWVWESDGSGSVSEIFHAYQSKWHRYFARIQNPEKLDEILQIFNDAWNYFPHRALDGKSPMQMAEQKQKKNMVKKHPGSRQKSTAQAMPEIIVGGHSMQWSDYWAMIAEMEHRQEPFKQWTDKEVLPKYKRFLSSSFAPRAVERHYYVAEMFFDRARHIGFLTLEEIRPDFIQVEFPHWWQTHVLFGTWSEQAVRFSLGKLFSFLELVYDVDEKKFGF